MEFPARSCILLLAASGLLAQSPRESATPTASEAASARSSPTIDEIMAKVAENQAQSQKERAEFVYKQSIKVVSRHTNGKMIQEENSEYLVTPTEKDTKKTAVRIAGHGWVKGDHHGYHDYLKIQSPAEKDEFWTVDPNDQSVRLHMNMIDNEIVDSFRNDLAHDNSKDGLSTDLFPLTAEQQKSYTYELLGTDTRNGREVYKIRFRPKDKNDIDWAGDALIDVKEYAPVLVNTKLSRRIPFAVRAFLGTDVPGLGFSVHYRRVADGVWFPVSFGTEFRLRAVFFINRDITMSLENSDFKRATAESTIHYEEPKEPQAPTQ